MANSEHVGLVWGGRKAIALWQSQHPGENLHLQGADLQGANLREADLHGVDLREADLREADLHRANLYRADLYGADLYGVDLYGVDLNGANLNGANLNGADLNGADLRGANLHRANLGEGVRYARVGPQGTRGDEIVYIYGPNRDEAHTGCRTCTLAELRLVVQAVHGGTQHEVDYMRAIDYLEAVRGKAEATP